MGFKKLTRIVMDLRASSCLSCWRPEEGGFCRAPGSPCRMGFPASPAGIPVNVCCQIAPSSLTGETAPSPSLSHYTTHSTHSCGFSPVSWALITAVSKPDSVIFINPSRDLHAKVPELTFSPNAVPPSWRRWRPCLRHTTYQPTIVAFEESADSGPTAQGATVSKTDSVVGENVFAEIQERETASSKPKDSAQSVNNKKRPTLEPLFT